VSLRFAGNSNYAQEFANQRVAKMQNMAFGRARSADSPILVAVPHIGTKIPNELLVHPAWAQIEGRLSDPAGVALLGAAEKADISYVAAVYHPCTIDFNVATDNRPLSQRLNRTGLCRTHTSRGEALYPEGKEPTEEEVEARVEEFWRPFHETLTAELLRLRKLHENVLLLVPHATSWLSPYRNQTGAADCNVGTDLGASCDKQLVSTLTDVVKGHDRSWVVNGKVADAFCASRYGMPFSGIHAIEFEVAGRWRAELETGARLDDGSADDSAFNEMLSRLEECLKTLPPAEELSKSALEANGEYD
jgi:N-formylglutamate deformylase